VDVIKNRKLVERIRRANRPVRIYGIGGFIDVFEVAELPGYGEVYFSEGALANILSLNNMQQRLGHVVYDNYVENAFVAEKENGSVFKFKLRDGLYVYDMREGSFDSGDEVALIATVEDNMSMFTKREIQDAETARKLYMTLARPSQRDFEALLGRKLIANCPVTVRDARNAEKILGKDLGVVKGRTVRERPDRVVFDEAQPLPKKLLEMFGAVELCCDFMFIDKLPIFMTVSRRLKFITAAAPPNRKLPSVLTYLKKVIDVYQKRGFVVRAIIADGEFSGIGPELIAMQISLNCTSRNEHVPEIESVNKLVKNRARGIITTWPYTKVPNAMKIHCVFYCVFFINMTPKKNGVSIFMSPREIVHGSTLDYNKHCRLMFGEYVQVHEDLLVTNTMQSRTTGAIALGPYGNEQGGYKFLSLTTGRVIVRRSWTSLPVPAEVVNSVAALAAKEVQIEEGLIFRDGNMNEILDIVELPEDDALEEDNAEEVLDKPVEVGDQGENDSRLLTGAEVLGKIDESPEGLGEVSSETAPENILDNVVYAGGSADVELVYEDNSGLENAVAEAEENPKIVDEIDMSVIAGKGAQVTDWSQIESTLGETSVHPRYNFRKRREKWSPHNLLVAITLTNYSIKKGLELFGEEAVESMISELEQLHRKNVFCPVDVRKLNHDQRSKILRTLMFLKRKRDGRLKSRACVDGSPQSRFDTETDPSSPTVSLEALMLSCVADAVEERTVVTADIQGAYLEVYMKDEVFVELDYVLAKMMLRVDPSYKKYLTPKKNGKGYKLVFRLNKALYGCVQKSARLFYEHLSKTLIDYGFAVNEYDQCVLNKMINGHQCTVVLYVDDLKISCTDPDAVEEVVKYLESVYTKINVNRGKVHMYLGMELDYSEKGFVKIAMNEMVSEIVESLGEEINGTIGTPAAQNLFSVRPEAEKLASDKSDLFHSIVAKLLYVAKRARPDILTSVCFLATRVKDSTVDDWKKLKRVLTYLNGTKELGLRLSASDMTLVAAFADASYAVHGDMKSHTGTVITLGEGAVYCKSTKQNRRLCLRVPQRQSWLDCLIP
jgi:hypothetical protein